MKLKRTPLFVAGLGLLLAGCGGRSSLLADGGPDDDRQDAVVVGDGQVGDVLRLDVRPPRPVDLGLPDGELPRRDYMTWDLFPPPVDRGVDQPTPVVDRGVDQPWPSVDRGVDQPWPSWDIGVDQPAPVVDRGVDQPWPSWDIGADGLWPYPDQGFNDDCYAATPLSFSMGSVTVKDTTAGAQDDLLLTTLDCTGYSTAGPDVFYQVQMKAGYRYRLELTTPSFNGAFYLFSRCNDPAGTCGAGMGADQHSWPLAPEQIVFAPPATDTYFVGVDGRTVTDMGAFTLTIIEELLPVNDVCEDALPLALLGGYGAVDGDTSQAMNALDLTDLSCIESSWSSEHPDTPGPDLFYAVSLVAGSTYLVTATPKDWDYSPTIYMFESCAQPKQTCVAGASGDFPGMGSSFTYTPTTSGTYTIAVDSISGWGLTFAGPFTLEVKTPP